MFRKILQFFRMVRKPRIIVWKPPANMKPEPNPYVEYSDPDPILKQKMHDLLVSKGIIK